MRISDWSSDVCSSDLDGSSPRVRGTRAPMAHCTSKNRFIPACAGNRQPTWQRYAVPSVHPRVCGEQTRSASNDLEMLGTSTGVRGTGGGHTGWKRVV